MKVRSFDVDFKQRATLEMLCRCFVDAAWSHAEALGVGYTHLAQQNKVWVLSRLLVQVPTYPRWGETLTLNTWPRAAKSVFAMRDFEILSSAGQPVAGGTSAWLVLDASSRRPQRPEKILALIRALPEKRAIDLEPQKLAACAEASTQLPTTARYSDIDVNRHVTSAQYIAWLLDAYPLEFHRLHAVSLLEVNYVSEILGEEAVSVTTQQTLPGEFCHAIVKSDGTEACRARLQWRTEGT
ncbi:MAG TPA: acyl-ACP thioesterase domain-containing protein [Bacillota bacterium]|nr:acyl-ACP thioesterase domain-containing protein [Bacillota bacterium]